MNTINFLIIAEYKMSEYSLLMFSVRFWVFKSGSVKKHPDFLLFKIIVYSI